MAFFVANSRLKTTLSLLAISILTSPVYAPPSANIIERDILTTTTSTQPYQILTTTVTMNPCPQPCGFYAQLCCAADQICSTDTNDLAQCVYSTTGPSSPPGSPPSCSPWSTSTYTTTLSFSSVSTYVVTYTRTELDVQVIIGTVSWQVFPTPSDCCAPPTPQPPTCDYARGETPCGNVCCAEGQYCQSAGSCASATPPIRPTSATASAVTVTFSSSLATATSFATTV